MIKKVVSLLKGFREVRKMTEKKKILNELDKVMFKDKRRAKELIDKLMKLDEYEGYGYLGLYYRYYEGNPDKALECYFRALELSEGRKDIHVLYYNIGRAYIDRKMYDAAMEYIKKAIKMKKDFWQAWADLAACYYKKHKYFEAKTAIEYAIKLNPNEEFLKRNKKVILDSYYDICDMKAFKMLYPDGKNEVHKLIEEGEGGVNE